MKTSYEYKALQLYNNIALLSQSRQTDEVKDKIQEYKEELENILKKLETL